MWRNLGIGGHYFNPRGLRRPRQSRTDNNPALFVDFNPRGLRRPRQLCQEQRKRLKNFNPRGLRRPRPRPASIGRQPSNFNPRGLRRPRPISSSSNTALESISIHEVFADLDGRLPRVLQSSERISIHEVFADLDRVGADDGAIRAISIHEVFADLDQTTRQAWDNVYIFQSTRSSQTSTPITVSNRSGFIVFQSTRSSQTSTGQEFHRSGVLLISIHEVFADLDRWYRGSHGRCRISIHEVFADLDNSARITPSTIFYFNPRGLRRPRHCPDRPDGVHEDFNPRGLRRPRRLSINALRNSVNFNPRGLRRPRRRLFQPIRRADTISIHEVFADLDPSVRPIAITNENFNPRGLRRPRQQTCPIKSISLQHIYTNIIPLHYIPPSSFIK